MFPDESELIDLTRKIESSMPVYPEDPPVNVEMHADIATDGYRVSTLKFGTHTGTHIDAPSHTEPDGESIETFTPDELRFNAHIVDCRSFEANTLIDPSVLPPLTDPATAIELIIFHTGWADAWGTPQMVDHPALAPQTAKKCASADVAIAIDTISPDPTGEETVPAHHALLGAGLPIIENICNITSLPDDTVELLVCPLRVDADGAPARVIAWS
ncbi:cyclase family protein [Haloquadratum walsbyi]|jgi:Predicted metal-dependent hydrolase|uniref:Putative metal-dependent hydrolase n=1 Tax=Haloquadratum walsbyi J07HQW2 TaxID=1238425 RepID=U1NEB5_9EURY|nr:cyclase family protein [Haloquadratum walsbyi]ERG95098.1 MAG: putative metal-dependent hydrolase [Haloquadratum walsbyi J07HQW2]